MKKIGFQERLEYSQWNPVKNLSRENPWNNPVEIPWRILLVENNRASSACILLSLKQENKYNKGKKTNTTKARKQIQQRPDKQERKKNKQKQETNRTKARKKPRQAGSSSQMSQLTDASKKHDGL